MAYTTINKSTDYFNTLLYAGSGSAQTVTGVGFNSDFTWIKSRNNTHAPTLFAKPLNSGLSHLYSNSTDAAGTGKMTSYNSDGYALPNNNETNNSGNNYVSWNWLANGVGSSNTDGSINTTYTSASTTSGFSMSTYTGTGSAATVGHGLGVAPKIVIVKRYSTSGGGWLMQNSNLTSASYVLKLNGEDAESNDGANFNSAAPTDNHFSVYNSNNTNASGANHIAYCFAEKTGFSKFGSYTGNGNADGPFNYTGFRPAFIMIKLTSSTESWRIYDSKRIGYNVDNKYLNANNTAAETIGSTLYMDILSNGFKLRGTDNSINSNNASYIFMAFAEAPIVGSNNVPANAR